MSIDAMVVADFCLLLWPQKVFHIFSHPIYYFAKENRCLYPFCEAHTQRIGMNDVSTDRK